MAKKPRRKVRKDKKQDMRLSSLENFVYKTIENKQQNFSQADLVITDLGQYYRPNILLSVGAEDGDDRPSRARIGNSITLMNQRLNFELRIPKPMANGGTQTVRLIVASSKDGAENLEFEDVLQYWKDLGGAAVGTARQTYTSHYTTKSDVNKRYNIHMDKVYSFAEGVNNIVRPRLKINYGTKKNPGKVVEYTGSSPLDDDPVNHKLTIMAVSDNVTTAEQPLLSYSIRSTYKDA